MCGGVSARTLFSASRGDTSFRDRSVRSLSAGLDTSGLGRDMGRGQMIFQVIMAAGRSKFLLPLQAIRDAAMRLRARRYLSLISPGDEPWVLDVGCAEGRLLKAFLRYGCRCFGVEHPDYPEERFLSPDQITYLKGDAALETLPLKRFDLVFLWHVIEHVQEPMP